MQNRSRLSLRIKIAMTKLLALMLCCSPVTLPTDEPKPIFDSGLVTSQTPGQGASIDVDLQGAERLFLVVTDGGNGYSCDWADWVDPRLTGPSGERRLVDMQWVAATSGWGQVRKNANAGGGPIRVAGKAAQSGIGTHANSLIEFRVPPGFTRFQARAALDDGGTTQGDGTASSVRFLVFTAKPPAGLLTPSGQNAVTHDADAAVAGLDVADGLEVTLFASEPMMLSPTNMDIDHLGRVWVCEVVNYRHFRNQNNPVREEGDRILILEDRNGDGRADKATTFYQGRDIDSAHGVCVLGDRAIVSANDSVFVLTDTDGDLKADRKDVLFTGISGAQHDHGIHAFVFGPDGKLYFNFGNAGQQLKDRDGKPIVDAAGNEVNSARKPYQEGMVFRCNLDGSELETIAWNFRNNWEVCVDSFGTLWQSDNDDDGNRGVRINFVMEYGNYGYKDELTGAGWREPRTGWADTVPERHWHLNDPGVVPNLLQTGAGSPTGICVYEGRLLPEVFRNQIIHCDAGPNVVRSYPATKSGAGYSATSVNILEGTRDKWFRPSDVCVAPDGSILIADWYDPGVGGHAMGDVQHGRIFRVAPPGTPWTVPQVELRNPSGAVAALASPNLATRFLAWQALHQMQQAAEADLLKLWGAPDPRLRARALWLLGNIDGRTAHYVQQAVTDADPDLRITGLRLARRRKHNVATVVRQLLNDPAPEVRRECLIALRELDSPQVPQMWARLALQHDGRDRWYLEALGIAANGRWDACLDAFEAMGGNFRTPSGRDIAWRSRGHRTAPLLAQVLTEPELPPSEAARYLRSFDFLPPEDAQPVLLRLAFRDSSDPVTPATPLVISEALTRLDKSSLAAAAGHTEAIESVLKQVAGTRQFARLIDQFELEDHYPDLLEQAIQQPTTEPGIDAVRTLLRKKQWKLLRDSLLSDDADRAIATAEALGNSAEGRAAGLLLAVIRDPEVPVEVRRAAVRGAGRLQNGAMQLAALAEQKALDESLLQAVAAALHSSSSRKAKEKANQLFPPPPSKENKPLPPLATLMQMKGNVKRGRLIYHNSGTCYKCHKEHGLGREVGPDLSEIGSKLSRSALFESILYPSAGISHNYETWTAALDSGNTVSGLMVSETDDSVSLKDIEGIVRTFSRDEIDEITRQETSLMPADLQKVLTAQDLVDLVEFLQTLKKK